MGLLFVTLLKQCGVPRVIVLGKRKIRLEAAAKLGADAVIDLDQTEDPVAAVRDLAPGGVCTAVECVGRPTAWSMAVDCLRKGGEALFYGGCPTGTSLAVDTRRMHYDALTLKGAFHFTPTDVRISLDLIVRRALSLDILITGEVPLDDLNQAFSRLEQGNCLKLAIVPEGVK
jgi:L-iditol 2-dehydrogenase